jgi:hypothetical protein
MKTSHLILLAALGVGAWLLMRPRTAGAAGIRITPGLDSVVEIPNLSVPGQEAWGWTYYNNGIAIGPDGSYYKNGAKVWSPA